MTLLPFSAQVREAFSRQVAAYEPHARLQQATAWRLAGVAAHHGWSGGQARQAPLVLPAGACADLGAGTGLVGRALGAWKIPLPAPLLQLDHCREALARNGSGPPLPWDLNQGLPEQLEGAALLTSSFALQWLDSPASALTSWGEALAPGGWLLLAVPTAGSFPEWRQAAERSGVPCSALDLPQAGSLLLACSRAGLLPVRTRTLTFSKPPPAGASPGPLAALRSLQAIGAGTSRRSPLSAVAWRRLLAAWPGGGQLSWEVLLLLARKPHPLEPTLAEGPRPGGDGP